MELNEGMATMSMSGESRFPIIEGLAGDDLRLIHYYNLYPHFLIGLNPDYAMVHRVWPQGPGRSQVICDWLFPQSTIDMPGFDLGEVVELWDTTNRQDWGLCEMVQQAAASRGARPGPYHPAEVCVHAFDSWFVRKLQHRLDALAD
jgi:Rieske 2Fe-2S family protein